MEQSAQTTIVCDTSRAKAMFKEYLRFIANRRCQQIGLKSKGPGLIFRIRIHGMNH